MLMTGVLLKPKAVDARATTADGDPRSPQEEVRKSYRFIKEAG
jgi:hypothetical protein